MKRATAFFLGMFLLFGSAMAETRWILCADYVNVRMNPSKKSREVGQLDVGDDFETDGVIRNGFIRVIGIGEYGVGWVYAGFTSDEKPEKVDERRVCVAKRRVACRRWVNGPRIGGKTGWLYNGSSVKVYYRTSKWSVTSRGYISSEWLEVDSDG